MSLRPKHLDFDLEDGPDAKITKDFLENLVTNLCRHATEYHGVYPDDGGTIFLYPERNLYSALAASVNHITPVHLSELPVRRKSGENQDGSEADEKGHHGRLDLWCLYRNREFLIELKRRSIGIANLDKEESKTFELKNAHKDAFDQVKDAAEFYWDQQQYERGDTPIIGLGITIVYLYKTLPAKTQHSQKSGNTDAMFENFKSLLQNHPHPGKGADGSFTSIWDVPEKMKEFELEDNGKVAYTPFIGFLTSVLMYSG